MHADISRDTFDPKCHHLRVVQEQGGLLLDADANEQTAILLHRLHLLALDLFGPFWGPNGGSAGFQIGPGDGNDLKISGGRYYVNGLLCENDKDAPATFLKQRDYPGAAYPDKFQPKKAYLVYLEVWEREVLEAELRGEPGRIDPAFQALAPCPRTEVAWQVRVYQNPELEAAALKLRFWEDPTTKVAVDPQKAIDNLLALLAAPGVLTGPPVPPPPSQVQLQARVKNPPTGTSTGDYAGPENQLYRVEIHRGGPPYQAGSSGGTGSTDGPKYATFKWSRDNGSVAFPLLLDPTETWQPDPKTHTFTVKLAGTGRDHRTGLRVHDRVEYIDAAVTFTPERYTTDPIRQLFEVIAVAPAQTATLVTLKATRPDPIKIPPLPAGFARWPFLRRWDFHHAGKHTQPGKATGPAPLADDGALLVVVPSAGDSASPEWLDLEEEIQIRFNVVSGTCQPGAFWLIPARTATGGIVWPQTPDCPQKVPARTPRHYYVPLAIFDPAAPAPGFTDCRRQAALGTLIPPPPPVAAPPAPVG
jgi:hypothetical protein